MLCCISNAQLLTRVQWYLLYVHYIGNRVSFVMQPVASPVCIITQINSVSVLRDCVKVLLSKAVNPLFPGRRRRGSLWWQPPAPLWIRGVGLHAKTHFSWMHSVVQLTRYPYSISKRWEQCPDMLLFCYLLTFHFCCCEAVRVAVLYRLVVFGD